MPYSNLRRFLDREGGSASFEHFMQEALYGEDGYYRRNISTVGRGGDFSTSATLSPLLGQAIARWLVQSWKEDGFVPHVLEIGPGSGQLMRSVVEHTPWLSRVRVKWHLVETSPILRAQQAETLGRKARFYWHSNMGPALEACEGKVMIFSNELPDAFPVQLLEKKDQTWHEVWLELEASGRLTETLREWAPQPTLLAESRTLAGFPEGQRIEFPAAWANWMQLWRPLWNKGRMLTIDYGGGLADIYHRRPQGTVRGYLRHQTRSGLEVYQNMGRQDLTADVCFEDHHAWGQQLGLETIQQENQAAFLRRWLAEEVGGTREEAYLLDEGGAGGAFQVLEQRVL